MLRNWIAHLWHEWLLERRRPISPAVGPAAAAGWPNDRLTAAWLGHSTVLVNFFGITILTDPVLFPRIGIRLPFLTIGPKRLTQPALEFHELPFIDLILLVTRSLRSHRHAHSFVLRKIHPGRDRAADTAICCAGLDCATSPSSAGMKHIECRRRREIFSLGLFPSTIGERGCNTTTTGDTTAT